MIPVGDENPLLRRPVVTYGLLLAIAGAWFVIQGAGELVKLLTSVCNLGLVPGELTKLAAVGTAIDFSPHVHFRAACVVDNEPVNYITPLTSMFLHGSWQHLIGNGLFLLVFGRAVEDSMGRGRFLAFYLLCGLAAATLHVATSPTSPVPMVGASGAISGVMGGYLLLYPRTRVKLFWGFFIFPIPAYIVLALWFAEQLLGLIPQLVSLSPEVSSGVAFFAHIGGFVAGLASVR
jgi:membrane associated rhomboid family serine protease